MTRHLLQTPHSSSPSLPASQQVNTELAVIVVATICGFICLLGLLLVSSCSWMRRRNTDQTPSTANKGLKKKVLNSLPKLIYGSDHVLKFTECAICLANFNTGDEVRVMPECGHGFHVGCVDTWLVSHSSCPSCRQILGEVKKSGGGSPVEAGCSSGVCEIRPEARVKSCLP